MTVGVPTNAERAERVQKILKAYAEEMYGTDDPDPEELLTAAGDLLADFLHYCSQEELDFDDAIRVARMHFEAEMDEET